MVAMTGVEGNNGNTCTSYTSIFHLEIYMMWTEVGRDGSSAD